MKKHFKAMAVAACILACGTASAQGISDILKGLGNSGTTIGNVIEGVFTKSDLTVEEIAGEYEATDPAVAFKGDNFLKKAGGIAAAGALETKLAPYYKQYGLTGMKLLIEKEGKFTMTVKGIKLMGTAVANKGEGTFTFNIMMGEKVKLGQFTAYVEKSGKNINLMFDATKLKDLVSTIGKFSGTKIAKGMGTLLDSYDGACIGFKMTQIKAPEEEQKGTGTVTNLLNSLKNRK